MGAMGSYGERQMKLHSLACWLLTSGCVVPNRPQTGTSLRPGGWGPLLQFVFYICESVPFCIYTIGIIFIPFYFLIFILFIFYLFILAVLGLSCGTQDLCCGMWDPQLQHTDSQLWHACGIQFPNQGSNPGPLHWEHGVLPTGPPGKSHHWYYFLDSTCK